jgi:hypothetical protein
LPPHITQSQLKPPSAPCYLLRAAGTLRETAMRFVLLSALSLFISSANAQPGPPPPALQPPAPPPPAIAPLVMMPVPVPPQGCVWASRSFSDGAAFCMGPSSQIICKAGRWDAVTTEACRAAHPIDAR